MSCLWHVLCHVYGMFCVVFVACFVTLIRRILWPVEKGYFQDDFGSKWRVLELPRSFLACYCIEARPLHSWASKCSSRVRNCVGFGAIA